MNEIECKCKGSRLNKEALQFKVYKKIFINCKWIFHNYIYPWMNIQKISNNDKIIGEEIIKET